MTKPAPAEAAHETGELGRSAQKHRAILDAAMAVFLEKGYLGASMDEIAALAVVSKQTVYKHCSTKEALFVEIVTSTTNRGSDKVHKEMPAFGADEDVADYLRSYAYRQLAFVLQPRILQLRRLVIGEVGRFPDLAKALFDGGPRRAILALAAALKDLQDRGLLAIDDPNVAASQFNWLIMGEPLSRTMLLGDDAIPSPAELRRHAAESVRMFLAAYGTTAAPAPRGRTRKS